MTYMLLLNCALKLVEEIILLPVVFCLMVRIFRLMLVLLYIYIVLIFLKL